MDLLNVTNFTQIQVFKKVKNRETFIFQTRASSLKGIWKLATDAKFQVDIYKNYACQAIKALGHGESATVRCRPISMLEITSTCSKWLLLWEGRVLQH